MQLEITYKFLWQSVINGEQYARVQVSRQMFAQKFYSNNFSYVATTLVNRRINLALKSSSSHCFVMSSIYFRAAHLEKFLRLLRSVTNQNVHELRIYNSQFYAPLVKCDEIQVTPKEQLNSAIYCGITKFRSSFIRYLSSNTQPLFPQTHTCP